MFKLLAIRPLEGCAPYIQKCLKTGLMYYFCNDYIIEPSSHIRRRSKNIKPLQENFFTVVSESDNNDDYISKEKTPMVSVSAVVGMNGDGKSTLMELMMRLINNCAITYNLSASSDDLRRVKKVKAELYYIVDNVLYCMVEEEKQKKTRIWKMADLDSSNGEIMRWEMKPKKIEHIEEYPNCFFFTIVSNYSHHAYNVYDYEKEWEVRGDEKDDDEKCWLHYIFHKNDNYLVPITLHPFRYKGNIDINNEKFLSKQRLLTLFLNADNPSKDEHSFRRVNGKDANFLKLTEEASSKLQQEVIIDYFRSTDQENKYNWLVETIDDLNDSINQAALSFDTDCDIIDDFEKLIDVVLPSNFMHPIRQIIDQDGFSHFVNKVVTWLKPSHNGDLWSVVTRYDDFIKKAGVFIDAMICNYNGGKDYYEKNVKGAFQEFDTAITLVPNYVEPYLNRAGLKYSVGDKEGALQDYDKTIELNPNLSEAFNNRGILKEELNDIAGAQRDFDKAIEIKPTSYEAYFNRGTMKDELGDKEGALQDYDKAIELNPNLSEAFNNRGTLKEELNDIAGAQRDFDKAIEIKPTSYEAYFNRGTMKDGLGDKEGALQDYDKAIELNPNLSEAYNNRGILKIELNDTGDALMDFDKAIEIDQTNYEAYFNRGTLKDDLGNEEGALQDYNKSIELNPEFHKAYNNRGGVFATKGKFSNALSDFTKAIQLEPNYHIAYNNRGIVYEMNGSLNNAINDYSEAIRLDPSYYKAYYNRGTVYVLKADEKNKKKYYEKAIKDYSKVIELRPSNAADSYFARSIVNLKKGNMDDALKDRDAAIEQNPQYADKNYSKTHRELIIEKVLHKSEMILSANIQTNVYYNEKSHAKLMEKFFGVNRKKKLNFSVKRELGFLKGINSTQLGRLDTIFRIMTLYKIDPIIATENYKELSLEEKCYHYIVYKVWSILSEDFQYQKIHRKDKIESLREYGIILEESIESIKNEYQSNNVWELKQVENFLKEGFKGGGLYNLLDKRGEEEKKNNGNLLVEIDEIKEYYADKSISIDNLPPPIYKCEIVFKKREDPNCDIELDSFSSGEKQLLNSIGAIIYHLQNLANSSSKVKYNNVNLIMEEIELYYHPEYQRLFFSRLLDLLQRAKLENIQNINIVFVTHSPFILSDIPKCNVLFLKDGMPKDIMQENTFGANIHTLLKNGFFMPNLPIGEFAYGKINKLFGKLNSGDLNPDEDLDDIYQEILLVGEPFLRNQLLMLYNSYKGSKLLSNK